MNKKAQIFSTDLVLSMIVFEIMIIFIFSIWNLYTVRLAQDINSKDLGITTFEVCEILISNQGIPENWQENPSNVTTIGLASNTNSLSQEKINSFLIQDYNQTKEKFNIERFEFNFKILDLNNNLLNSTGLNTTEETEEIISIQRFIDIENNTRQTIFTLWY